MHCNLKPPDGTPALFRFNYDAMLTLKSLDLSIALTHLVVMPFAMQVIIAVLWRFGC